MRVCLGNDFLNEIEICSNTLALTLLFLEWLNTIAR